MSTPSTGTAKNVPLSQWSPPHSVSPNLFENLPFHQSGGPDFSDASSSSAPPPATCVQSFLSFPAPPITTTRDKLVRFGADSRSSALPARAPPFKTAHCFILSKLQQLQLRKTSPSGPTPQAVPMCHKPPLHRLWVTAMLEPPSQSGSAIEEGPFFHSPQAPPRTRNELDYQSLRAVLRNVDLDAWYCDLRFIGMTDARLRTLSRFAAPRRDAILLTVLPSMNILDRALLSDAIQRLVQII
ncbi:hypothetical protein DFH06DRAFT_1477196 [Mycena polygramma]|nr:hypothetical protein DFH06DRAFT_1477196 [Mycena polygramma]